MDENDAGLIVTVLILIGVALAAVAYASFDQVGAAAAAARTEIAAPGSAEFIGGWSAFIGKLALGFLGGALFTAAVAWISGKIRQGNWNAGPNARWGREPREPRDAGMNIQKIMELAMMNRILGGNPNQPLLPMGQAEPEEKPETPWW